MLPLKMEIEVPIRKVTNMSIGGRKRPNRLNRPAKEHSSHITF